MPYPQGLKVTEHLPPGGWTGYRGPVVILVHGSLDRGSSFTRTIRRLEGWAAVTYDRRGYQGSRLAGKRSPAPGLAAHVDDLLELAGAVPATGSPLTAVGHSLGGDVVVGAALAEPRRFASIAAFEPPMPWLGFRRDGAAAGGGGTGAATSPWPPPGTDPGEEVERFFRRMVGDATWERLPESMRRERRADGPALVADLQSIRGPAPFDVTALDVPVLFGRSGTAGDRHHRETADWLAGHVPGAELMEIDGAGHGAHLSHPDGFAGFVRRAVALGAGVAQRGGSV